MAEQRPIRIQDTVKVALTPGAVTAYTNTGIATLFRLYADRNFHVKETGASPLTVDNGMPVCVTTPVYVQIAANQTIDFTPATGEIAGNIWITSVSLS